MIQPERRTRGDLVAALVIAVVVAVAAALIWWTSDARATISQPATAVIPSSTPARAVPAVLDQLWSAASPKTTTPTVVGGTVVTGDGRGIVGRDPVTGAQLWLFARDRELCGVTYIYDLAVAAYPDDRGCGQVSTVDASTGRRGPTRSGYADKQVTFSSDGTMVLAAGATRLEMWRSDMVRTLAWGPLDAEINPPVQPQPPCTFVSSEASSEGVSILEACPNAPDLKLAMLKVAKDDVAPEQKYAEPVGVDAKSGVKVLTMSGLRTAVYLPAPQPRIVVYDETGAQVSATLLPKPAAPTATMSSAGSMDTFWTGESVVVMDGTTLTTRYTIAAGTATPIGPGVMMANRLLIPVTNGVAVYDPANGAFQRLIPVNRGPTVAGPVVPAVAGSTVLEQRGGMVVALGERH